MGCMVRYGVAMIGFAVSSCSWLYPYRRCREGIGAQECRVVESWSGQWNGHYERFSLIGNDCTVDMRSRNGYGAMVDSGCDGLVDLYIDDAGSMFRDEFGSRYDRKFSEVKDKIWGDNESWGFMQR